MLELAHSLSWLHPMAYRVMIPSDQVLIPGHKIPLNQFIESDMSMFCTNRILPKFSTMNYYTYTLCCSSPGYFLQASSSSHQWSLEILQQTALQNRTRRISRFSSAAYEPFQAPTTLDPQDGPSMLHDGPSFPLFHWYWYIYILIFVSVYIYIYWPFAQTKELQGFLLRVSRERKLTTKHEV